MKARALTIATVAATLFAAGCVRPDKAKESSMSTELEMQHLIDIGTILDTTVPLELSIPVKNLSQRVVTVTRVSKDCSCTSVSIDKTKLQPGETAKLRVLTNLTGKGAVFIGQIVVESDSAEKVDEIQIQGRITGQIRIRPLRTALLMGDKDAPGSFTVFCDDQDGKWTYDGFSADDPNLHVDLKATSESPTTAVYAGTVTLPPAERGKYPDYSVAMVTLHFEHQRLGRKLELKLPVDLVVRRKITADPPQVTFDRTAAGQTRTVLLQSAEPIDIDSAACESPCVKPNLRWLDRKTLLVELAFDPAKLATPPRDGLACSLLFTGHAVARIPINVVAVP